MNWTSAIVACSLLFATRACHPKDSPKLRHLSPTPAFTSTVDWYKPPPQRIPEPEECVTIPRELVQGVAGFVFDDAITLLGEEDVIELNAQDAQRFAPNRDPDALIESLITQKKKDLQFLTKHPAESWPAPKAMLGEMKASDRARAENLNSEVKQFEQWKHRLKPYLIKAVTLQGTGGFAADLCGEGLFVEQISLGGAPLPMKRMPVVAFLPKKPHRIYTTVSMMD